eukprot:15557755-Heterocapsa_arctica.AAC.1
MQEIGEEPNVVVHTDSSAALVIVARRGVGRIKYLAVRELWLPDQLRAGNLTVEKVASEDNIVDILTKALGTARHQRLREIIGVTELEDQ